MIKTLLWKDLRVQRVAILAATCVIVAPYVYAAYEYLGNGSPISRTASEFRASLDEAGRITLIASLLVVAMLAGAAFAAERSDRSHEFLVTLPPTRLAILVSKILVVAAATAALWLLNPYVFMRIATVLDAGPTSPLESADQMLGTVSAMALSVLGTGWLGSILVSNPASSLLIGLLSPFFSLLAAFGISDPARDGNAFRVTFVCACLISGVSSLVGGAVCFLRREKA